MSTDGIGRGGPSWEWAEVRSLCLRVALRLVTDPHLAEDVAQEAALRAWRHRARLRDVEKREYWISSIVRNEAHRARGRKAREIESADIAENLGGEGDGRIEAASARLDVRAAIGRLCEEDQLLVRLRYGEDLTQPAISKALGVPEGTVKVRLHRVRTKLYRALEEQ